MLSCAGVVLLAVSALLYHIQRSSRMFDLMRPYIIITNLMSLIWFVALQYYRFKDTGRACSGDLLKKMPGNFGQVYMPEQGQWFRYYIIA